MALTTEFFCTDNHIQFYIGEKGIDLTLDFYINENIAEYVYKPFLSNLIWNVTSEFTIPVVNDFDDKIKIKFLIENNLSKIILKTDHIDLELKYENEILYNSFKKNKCWHYAHDVNSSDPNFCAKKILFQEIVN